MRHKCILSNNLICYCENNPVNTTDYYGHSWFKDKIVDKVKEYAEKTVKVVKEAASTVTTTVKAASKVVAETVKEVAETAAGAIAQKATTLLVKGISGITTAVISDQETKTKIKNIAGHVIDTINNETARDFWNIYVLEFGSTVLQELKPIASYTWSSAKNAITNCIKNRNFSTLNGDWNTYFENVKNMLMGMSDSVTKLLDIYKKMKVEPATLDQSNSNYQKNIVSASKQQWYPNNDYIHFQNLTENNVNKSDVADMICGDGYPLETNGCGLIASYNAGRAFGRNVDLPSIIYWYEQNSGLTLGGILGVNPVKVKEFLNTINLDCEYFEDIHKLEESRLNVGGVYIVCQWNNKDNLGEGAHFYMTEANVMTIDEYNNGERFTNYVKPTTFIEALRGGLLICAYRVFEKS